MIARLCYYYGYTPDQVLHLTMPQFFFLYDKLGDLIKNDSRGGF